VNGRGVVLAADLGATNLRLALADDAGQIVARRRASTAGIRDPHVVVRMIREAAPELLAEAGLGRSSLRAAAVGSPGVTDVDRGVVIATSYLLGWRDVPLREYLEEELGVPAAVDNDVNLAALGEARAGAGRAVDDFVFLAIGTGVGAGIVLNRRLHRGSAWTAGEIGYLLVPGTSESPIPRGEPGALESMLGGEGIRRRWKQQWNAERTRLPDNATAAGILDAAHAGDPLASEILHTAARVLSCAIYDMALILNCPLFVLGGSVGLHPALGESVSALLAQRDARVQPRIERSPLGDDAQLTGAIYLALDRAAQG
jgi:glucokinase